MAARSMTSLHTHNRGRAVEAGFQLPWNTTRSMADVWELSADQVARINSQFNPDRLPPRPREIALPTAREIPVVHIPIPYAGREQ